MGTQYWRNTKWTALHTDIQFMINFNRWNFDYPHFCQWPDFWRKSEKSKLSPWLLPVITFSHEVIGSRINSLRMVLCVGFSLLAAFSIRLSLMVSNFQTVRLLTHANRTILLQWICSRKDDHLIDIKRATHKLWLGLNLSARCLRVIYRLNCDVTLIVMWP
jgi:hypothetical protein